MRGRAVTRAIGGTRTDVAGERMRRKITFTLVVVLALLGSSFLLARRTSDGIVSPRFESSHFRFFSASGDIDLARTFGSVLEKDYARLRDHYGRDLPSKPNIRLFTSNLLYNMAFGNPFPLPRRAGNYAGQHIEHDVYALIPGDWKPQPDTVFPPERARTTVAHEMAHAFVFEINPDVKGWVTEGIAQYEQTAVFDDLIRKHGFSSVIGKTIEEGKIPKFGELFAGHKVTSSEITGDYLFAGSFIDYAAVTYGFRGISAFVKTNDFSSSFGGTEREIWEGWVRYLKDRYVSR
jgi:hypothetical protein